MTILSRRYLRRLMMAQSFNLISRTPMRSEICGVFRGGELFHKFSHPVVAAAFASGSATDLESSDDSRWLAGAASAESCRLRGEMASVRKPELCTTQTHAGSSQSSFSSPLEEHPPVCSGGTYAAAKSRSSIPSSSETPATPHASVNAETTDESPTAP